MQLSYRDPTRPPWPLRLATHRAASHALLDDVLRTLASHASSALRECVRRLAASTPDDSPAARRCGSTAPFAST